jgi:hypothetical protein
LKSPRATLGRWTETETATKIPQEEGERAGQRHLGALGSLVSPDWGNEPIPRNSSRGEMYSGGGGMKTKEITFSQDGLKKEQATVFFFWRCPQKIATLCGHLQTNTLKEPE